MQVALHTASPEDNGFIEYVLHRVDKGTLPLDLVEKVVNCRWLLDQYGRQ